jgi:hypothetical protein
MALRRLKSDTAYRFYLASLLAFEDWENPTLDELNANPTNDPNGLIFNITCAVDQGSTTFDLDDPDTDDSLTFCQSAGFGEPIEYSATIVYGIQLAKERWMNAAVPTLANGYNSSTLAQSLLLHRGVPYFAIMSIGKDEDAPFAENDRIKMAEIETDYAVPDLGTGDMSRMTQTPARRSRINWNYKLTA